MESYGIFNNDDQTNDTVLDKISIDEFIKHCIIKENRFYVQVLRKAPEDTPIVPSNSGVALQRFKVLDKSLTTIKYYVHHILTKLKKWRKTVAPKGTLSSNWHLFDSEEQTRKEQISLPTQVVII